MEGSSSLRGVGGGRSAQFVVKTYEMVDDSATDEIVSWSDTNNSFIVWNPTEFARLLLPSYFSHNNFNSFIRQLNTYVCMYLFVLYIYITLYVRIYHHFFNCQYPLIKFLHFFYNITCMTIYEILHTPHPWKSLRFFLAVGVQRASTRWNICLSFPLFLMF